MPAGDVKNKSDCKVSDKKSKLLTFIIEGNFSDELQRQTDEKNITVNRHTADLLLPGKKYYIEKNYSKMFVTQKQNFNVCCKKEI